MKLTKEEVQKKSQEKVTAIQTLCKQLEVVISAEQVVTNQGFIKQIVYYTDVEAYDIAEDKQPNEKTYEEKDPAADQEVV